MLRVRPSGKHSYLVSLGRGEAVHARPRRRPQTGEGALRSPAASSATWADGLNPIAEKARKTAATFADFLEKHYEPWAHANLKHARSLLLRVSTRSSRGHSVTSRSPRSPPSRWNAGAPRDERTGGTKATANSTSRPSVRPLQSGQWGVLLKQSRAREASEGRPLGDVRFLDSEEENPLRHALEARDKPAGPRGPARTSGAVPQLPPAPRVRHL